MQKSEPLLDFNLGLLHDECPNVEGSTSSTIGSLLSRFISGEIDYSEIRGAVLDLSGSAGFVGKLQEILTCPDDPIPEPRVRMHFDGTGARKTTQPWTGLEDVRLLAAVHRFGLSATTNWTLVAQFVGNGRSRSQCSQRWIRVLDPRISKRHWTPEEDARLAEFVRRLGEKSWMKIACEMGNRSDVQCRYRYIQMRKEDANPNVAGPLDLQIKRADAKDVLDVTGDVGVPLRSSLEVRKSDSLYDSSPWLLGMD
jgi:hypothetical protein